MIDEELEKADVIEPLQLPPRSYAGEDQPPAPDDNILRPTMPPKLFRSERKYAADYEAHIRPLDLPSHAGGK